MTYGPTQILSRGKCIYCGKSNCRLTDEHIVPLSLGGKHVLKEASCDACAKITSNFELEVARNLWGDARISYNAPSRRKAKRPKYYLHPNSFSPANPLRIPYSEYPAPMLFYRMPLAGILLGHPPSVDQSALWQLVMVSDAEKTKTFEEKWGVALQTKFKHVPDDFARLLIKIAYGQILTSLGPDDFNPICLPYLLNPGMNYSYIVGGRWDYPPAMDRVGYSMSTNCISFPDRLLLIAEIRLVANSMAPVYHVVVGDVVGKELVENAMSKIEATLEVKVSDERLYKKPDSPQFHWMPTTWPMPGWSP